MQTNTNLSQGGHEARAAERSRHKVILKFGRNTATHNGGSPNRAALGDDLARGLVGRNAHVMRVVVPLAPLLKKVSVMTQMLHAFCLPADGCCRSCT